LRTVTILNGHTASLRTKRHFSTYSDCHTREGGYPVRCALSFQSRLPLEYWVPRLRGGRQVNVRPRSRGMFRPSFATFLRPTKRGRRECRVLAAPAVSRAISAKSAHTSIQVQSEHSGIPCAVVLRLMARSPWRRIPLASIAGGLTIRFARLGTANLRKLDASHGRQDHTVLPYATAPYVLRGKCPLTEIRPASPSRARRCRVHRIPPHVRDDGQRPSTGTGWREL
jgi:hypothetical protein